jgi:hypothetical protein
MKQSSKCILVLLTAHPKVTHIILLKWTISYTLHVETMATAQTVTQDETMVIKGKKVTLSLGLISKALCQQHMGGGGV